MVVIESEMDEIREKIRRLEIEMILVERKVGVIPEQKDLRAWSNLNKLGKKIGVLWKSKKPSWQLISESRR
ncbi:MAG: hypothetical protein QMC80_05355 [Thermoplasmatales archaeon]|nr:hypothetical protein [Thermoplasmatales archaeon]